MTNAKRGTRHRLAQAERLSELIATVLSAKGACRPADITSDAFTTSELLSLWPLAFALARVAIMNRTYQGSEVGVTNSKWDASRSLSSRRRGLA
ncbi:MAG: hypothetical protein AB7E52_00220 [Bdellovibrionales bacterium]